MTWPVGVSLGSTTTLFTVIPTNSRLRLAESMGRKLPLESTLSRAVEQVPCCSTVHRHQETDARNRGVALATGHAPSSGDDDRLIGIVVPREDRDTADLIPGRRAEVRKRNISRAAGIGRQKIGRLPDSATGSRHINCVARRVGWIHCDRTHLTGGTRDRRWTDRRPLFARQTIGLTQREDGETSADVVASLRAQSRGRQRLLEAQ